MIINDIGKFVTSKKVIFLISGGGGGDFETIVYTVPRMTHLVEGSNVELFNVTSTPEGGGGGRAQPPTPENLFSTLSPPPPPPPHPGKIHLFYMLCLFIFRLFIQAYPNPYTLVFQSTVLGQYKHTCKMYKLTKCTKKVFTR